MKIKAWLIILVFAVISAGILRAADAASSTPPRIPPERVDLKVLKVISAHDDGHVHRAYLVEWKGQEVIADDRLAKTTYQVGDIITVLVMKLPHPDKNENFSLLHFSVVPPRRR